MTDGEIMKIDSLFLMDNGLFATKITKVEVFDESKNKNILIKKAVEFKINENEILKIHLYNKAKSVTTTFFLVATSLGIAIFIYLATYFLICGLSGCPW